MCAAICASMSVFLLASSAGVSCPVAHADPSKRAEKPGALVPHGAPSRPERGLLFSDTPSHAQLSAGTRISNLHICARYPWQGTPRRRRSHRPRRASIGDPLICVAPDAPHRSGQGLPARLHDLLRGLLRGPLCRSQHLQQTLRYPASICPFHWARFAHWTWKSLGRFPPHQA